MAEKFTVWVAQRDEYDQLIYLLHGIRRKQVTVDPYNDTIVRVTNGWGHRRHVQAEWYRDRAGAVRRMEKLRVEEIAELEERIAELKTLTFEEDLP